MNGHPWPTTDGRVCPRWVMRLWRDLAEETVTGLPEETVAGLPGILGHRPKTSTDNVDTRRAPVIHTPADAFAPPAGSISVGG
ncbi:hypothetical protein ABZV93_12840 [Actinopolymorpha sp. NPDC004070]|uniref:hypothetical protein n=1 Tax=Actinopolymorpha sp. NPDC004070 TaxID=3154548 RepID=UPI0033BE8D87